VSENVQFAIDGATLNIPKDQLLQRWLSTQLDTCNRAPRHPAYNMIAPRIGEGWNGQGGVYVGIIGGENGAPDYHLIRATDEHEIVGANWQAAGEQAKKKIEGFTDWSLPDRREARLIHINASAGFDKDAWYWTSTQNAANVSCAWYQYFFGGGQSYYRKTYEGRARAVRRILIIE